MNLAVFGSSGMLGFTLTKLISLRGIKATFFSRRELPGELSVIPYERFEAETYDPSSHDFDFVINCCGLIKQRASDAKSMIDVNSNFPRKMAEKYGSRLIHVSTDCVFSGKKGQYVETDAVDCEDSYGKSKADGEKCEARILRTSIIGTHPHDKHGLLEWVRSSSDLEVKGYVDHYWSGVTTLRLAEVILEEMQNLREPGVRHIYSDRLSKFELLNLISHAFELKAKITPTLAGKIDRSLSTVIQDNRSNGNLLTQLNELALFERTRL